LQRGKSFSLRQVAGVDYNIVPVSRKAQRFDNPDATKQKADVSRLDVLLAGHIPRLVPGGV
jgi:hypothetical protein